MASITEGEQVNRLVRFPHPLYLALKKRALTEHRSIQGQIIVAIEEHLKKGKR